MAKTVTTTDKGRDFPTDAKLKTLVGKVNTHERGAFTVGDAIAVLIPRDVAHWRHRSISGETVKEAEVFAILAATEDSNDAKCNRSANTLIQWRNVATAFPKAVRVEGVSFAAHKYLAALAWKNKGARRSAIVEWMTTNKPTAAEARDHAKAMRLADSPPTTKPEDGGNAPDSAADANGAAVATIDGDGLVATVFAALDAHNGTMATEDKAAIRCVGMLADALGVTVTHTPEDSVLKDAVSV
tara:strand:- start:760 stop:1485 length:726 start_codon:yes stop_codon:yes gene_type:complete